MDPVAENILDFWFGTTDPCAELERRDVWFKATPEFDAHLVENYTGVLERAAAGAFDHFVKSAADCLALIVALDQFPRNIHRGTPRAYEADPKAREIAAAAIDRGYDRNFSYFPRVFVYLPFEHSECLTDQERSVALFSSLGEGPSLDASVGHYEAIRRFGRFPHRNAVLGRRKHAGRERISQGSAVMGNDRRRGGGTGTAQGMRVVTVPAGRRGASAWRLAGNCRRAV